jgi:hypothetical protein
MLYATKQLQKESHLYHQIQRLEEDYYHLSLKNEYKQNTFLQQRLNITDQTGVPLALYHSFEKSYKTYTKSIEQKVYTIEHIARERHLVPIFVTLTLPSKYHPLISRLHKNKRLYVDHNPEFEFEYVEEAISDGYKYLNNIFRTFYKRIKHHTKSLYYVKVAEFHKTFIPHFHCLFFVPASISKIFLSTFDNIVTEFQLSQVDLELVGDKQMVKSDISNASKYLMKYVTKSLSDGADFYQARIIDGWKKRHKIRMISMSQLPLSLTDYRQIYHSIDQKLKDELLQRAKNENMNLFTYIQKNMFKMRVLLQGNETIKTDLYGLAKNEIHLFISVDRKRLENGFSYTTKSFIVTVDKKVAYQKQKYIKMQN